MRVPPDLEGALCVPEQVRVVALLPDEHEVGGGHEVGDEETAARRARERIRLHAPPAGVVAGVVVTPQVLVLEELLVGEDERPSLRYRLRHASTIDAK